jgi:predicted lipoprotein with Yx(FWY)xxD motif
MLQLSSGVRRLPTTIVTLAAITTLSLTVAACGSSSSGSGSGANGSSAKSTAANTSAVVSKSTGSDAAVATAKVPGYGTVLATGHGAPLYLLTADPSGGSSCSGVCAKQWPPLIATGKPAAGSGVSQSLLSSFKRADGSAQVLYAGHALYTHPGTSATAVAGTASDGGIWYLVSPSGKPIKTTNGSGY